jgi:DNA-binding MarR family transcriptional regulator
MSNVMSVFAVLRLIRDARSTRNADRALLMALGLRCQPAKKFLCWPSYRQLALDTQLDEVTLKRAAKRLEDAGLIKRVVRQNRSNAFFLNISLLQDQAAAVKAADEEAKKAAFEDEGSPFAQPMSFTDDEDNDDNHSGWLRGRAR